MRVEEITDQPQVTVTPQPSATVMPGPHPGGARRVKRRKWLRFLVLCVLCGVAWWAYHRFPDARIKLFAKVRGLAASVQGSLFKGATAPASPPTRTIPVLAAEARRGDLPIYLDKLLGTVTAYNSVTIRTRVDGQLVKVAFVEGQMVHEGDLLAQVDPQPFEVQLAQAEGQKAKDEAALKNARADLARYQGIASRAVTQQQRDAAEATVGQLEGTVKSDQAQIDAAKLQLTYCRITAPITGRIGLRAVDQGNLVHANDQMGLATIAQLQPIAVVFPVWEGYLPQALKASSGGHPLKVEAYSSDTTRLLATGVLEAIDNQINPDTGTARLKARFENQDNMLFPNQFVNVKLLVETRKGVVLIPAAAVQRSPQNTAFAYVINPDDTVRVQPITIGPTQGGITLVEDGLAPGELVVTDGVDKLQPGSKVKVGQAGASATGPATGPAGGPGGRSGRPGATRPAAEGGQDARPPGRGDRAGRRGP